MFISRRRFVNKKLDILVWCWMPIGRSLLYAVSRSLWCDTCSAYVRIAIWKGSVTCMILVERYWAARWAAASAFCFASCSPFHNTSFEQFRSKNSSVCHRGTVYTEYGTAPCIYCCRYGQRKAKSTRLSVGRVWLSTLTVWPRATEQNLAFLRHQLPPPRQQSFSAVTPLVERQEGHPVCRNWPLVCWWYWSD